MSPEFITLPSAAPGTSRQIAVYRYGTPGARPKVYLQAGLHADEMPGVLVLQHLMGLLERAEVTGEVIVVPAANPIGLTQWRAHRPIGRFEADTGQNFNRLYPDLAPRVGDRIQGRITDDVDENTGLIRREMQAVLAEMTPASELDAMRLSLLGLSIDADVVLDLHCDTEAVLHHYASTILPEASELLGRSIGSELALLCEISGGNAFDEAHTTPWAALQRRFGDRVEAACFSSTVEYRGQLDVDDQTAAGDAANLMTYLAAVGAVAGDGAPKFDAPPAMPLEGYIEVMAPQGGVLTWQAKPGAWVKAGDVLGHVTNPMTRERIAVKAPIDGLMFRREMYRACLRGQGLAHVAGFEKLRSGDLLTA